MDVITPEKKCKESVKVKVAVAKESPSNIQKDGPDGRSAWVVAFAALFINFIMAGLTRMSGLLFVAFIDYFGVDRQEAAMPFSVRSSTGNLLGPLIGILGQKYGSRAVILCGGAVATMSAASCFFAPSVTWLTILWGGLNGFGVALIVILPQVVIGQYFDKYKTTASGMAFSGGCFGAFIFPVVLEKLIPYYGVGGTFLLIAGMIMNTIPAAMLLRKPSWLRKQKGLEDIESLMDEKSQRSTPIPETPKLEKNGKSIINEWAWNTPNSNNTIERFSKNGPSVQYLRQHSDIIMKMLIKVKTGNDIMDRIPVVTDNTSETEVQIWSQLEDLFRYIQLASTKSHYHENLAFVKTALFTDRLKDEALQVSQKVKNPTGKLLVPHLPLQKSKSVPDFVKLFDEIPPNFVLTKLSSLHNMRLSEVLNLFPKGNRRTLSKISRELRKLYNASARIGQEKNLVKQIPDIVLSTKKSKCPKNQTSSTWSLIKSSVLIHKDPRFMLICFCRIVHFVCFMPTMTTVVDFVKDKGLDKDDGKFAIAALAFGDLIGRLCLGWVTDRGYLKLGRYMLFVMLLQGATTICLPLMHTRLTLLPILALMGLLQGSLFVRHPVLVSQYLEISKQSIAMGCMNFFSGILGLGIPTYIGYFRDTIGSYDYVFYMNGIMGMLFGLLWLFEPYLHRQLPQKQLVLV